VRNAASMIAKAGESPDLLRCGGHIPLSRAVYEQYVRDGYRWGRLEDNCSGKHAGMIAAARAWGEPARTYADPGHPVQRRNLGNVALFTGLPADGIAVGTDGCAVPGCAVPLEAMARGMASFTTPEEVPSAKAEAARRILDVALRHPEMVAGEGRYDTSLIRAGGGRLLTKVGAEAVQIAGIVGEDLGVAVKIADGSWRALEAVMTSLLVELGVVDERDVADYLVRPVLTREGDKVGDLTVTLG
jgi:L-asparaginase II